MVNGREDWQEMGEKNLIEVLADAQACSVTDIRDRIFAFIGLADRGYGIVPDYDIDASMVFRLVCKRIILYERSLNILTCCTTNFENYSRREGIPSWTPDWSLPDISPFEFIYDPVDDFPPFRASSDYSIAAPFYTQEDFPNSVLKVQCLFIDDVAAESSLGPRSDGHLQKPEEWKRIAGLRGDGNEDRYQFGQSVSIVDALVGVILRGKRKYLQEGDDFERRTTRIGNETLELGRFFRSPSGYLGVAKGNFDVRSMDQICVLLGANVPFILRKLDNHFVLITDAYFEVLMYGEAIDMMIQGKLTAETINIH